MWPIVTDVARSVLLGGGRAGELCNKWTNRDNIYAVIAVRGSLMWVQGTMYQIKINIG